MSVLGLSKLTWALEHVEGLVEAFRTDPPSVMKSYALSDDEKSAVLRLDASDLRDRGMNPVALRNLLVLLGVPHGQMYTHDQELAVPVEGGHERE